MNMDGAQPSSTLSVEIGGIRLDARALPADLGLIASPAMNLFRCPPGPAHVSTTVDWGDLSGPATGTRVFRSGGLWDLWRDGDELVYQFSSPVMGPHPYSRARFDRDLSQGEIRLHQDYDRWRPGKGIEPFSYPLDELLLAQRLPRLGGIELHACGIVDEQGRGHLFVGQSGAGKSTTARLWFQQRAGLVLSDDRIVVRLGPGGPRMFGTPWHGEAALSAAADAPLHAIYLLHKDSDPRLQSVSPGLAAARLLACSFPPFHDREALGLTAGLAAELATQVPCAELHSRMDTRFLDLLHKT